MANNHGTAILSFDADSRAAVYEDKTVVVDSVPNPMLWDFQEVPSSGSREARRISYCGGSLWFIGTTSNVNKQSTDNGVTWPDTQNMSGNAPWYYGYDGSTYWICINGAVSEGTNSVYYGNSGSPVHTLRAVATPLPNMSWSPPVWGNGIWMMIQIDLAAATAGTKSTMTNIINNSAAWTALTLPSDTYSNLLFDGTNFIAVGATVSYYSTDGVIWTTGGAHGLPNVTSNANAVGNGYSVIVRNTGSSAIASTNDSGITWVIRSAPASMGQCYWKGVAFNGTYFIFLGRAFDFGQLLFTMKTANPQNFMDPSDFNLNLPLDATLNWLDLEYGNGLFMTTESTSSGGAAHKLMKSVDGKYSKINTRTANTVITLKEPAKACIGSNYASVSITGQTALLATDSIDAWIQANDSTSSHNAIEHKLAPIKLSVTNIVPGTGFDIIGISDQRLTGDFKVRWAWAS